MQHLLVFLLREGKKTTTSERTKNPRKTEENCPSYGRRDEAIWRATWKSVRLFSFEYKTEHKWMDSIAAVFDANRRFPSMIRRRRLPAERLPAECHDTSAFSS